MTRKLLTFALLATTLASLATVPSRADHCSDLKNQISVSTGRTLPGAEHGGYGTGPTGSVTGRFSTGGTGCDIEDGFVLVQEDTAGQSEVRTPGLRDDMNTQFIMPQATHFQIRALMRLPCPDCNKPGTGPSPHNKALYFLDKGSGYDSGHSITWYYDYNEKHWRSNALALAASVDKIKIQISITDDDSSMDEDIWSTQTRTYARCNSENAPAPANSVCVPD